jgi:hypothetical protein
MMTKAPKPIATRANQRVNRSAGELPKILSRRRDPQSASGIVAWVDASVSAVTGLIATASPQ